MSKKHLSVLCYLTVLANAKTITHLAMRWYLPLATYTEVNTVDFIFKADSGAHPLYDY